MWNQVVRVKKGVIAACMTCPLCNNLVRDATTISLCLHTFCRKCIHKKLSDEEVKCCPICEIDLGVVPLKKLRRDHNLQDVRSMIFPFKRRKTDAPEAAPSLASPARRKERSLSSLVVNTPRVSLQMTGRRSKVTARETSRGSSVSNEKQMKKGEDSESSISSETLTKFTQHIKQNSATGDLSSHPVPDKDIKDTENEINTREGKGKADLWKPVNCVVEAANRSKSSKFTLPGSALRTEPTSAPPKTEGPSVKSDQNKTTSRSIHEKYQAEEFTKLRRRRQAEGMDAGIPDSNVDAWLNEDVKVTLDEALRMIRQEYLVSPRSDATTMQPADVYEAINTMYKNNLKCMYMLACGLKQEFSTVADKLDGFLPNVLSAFERHMPFKLISKIDVMLSQASTQAAQLDALKSDIKRLKEDQNLIISLLTSILSYLESKIAVRLDDANAKAPQDTLKSIKQKTIIDPNVQVVALKRELRDLQQQHSTILKERKERAKEIKYLKELKAWYAKNENKIEEIKKAKEEDKAKIINNYQEIIDQMPEPEEIYAGGDWESHVEAEGSTIPKDDPLKDLVDLDFDIDMGGSSGGRAGQSEPVVDVVDEDDDDEWMMMMMMKYWMTMMRWEGDLEVEDANEKSEDAKNTSEVDKSVDQMGGPSRKSQSAIETSDMPSKRMRV